jgi:threonine/homoserine/homoserine lactone efflux protein
MPPGSILAFWGVAALLIAVPGVDWAFAINAGLRRQALPAAAGIVLGYLAMTAVVAAGLGALITSTPIALTALTVTGALYLTWLGTTAIHPPGRITTTHAAPGNPLLRGMAVSTLNPKGLLIFVTILPRFADPHGSFPMPVQLSCLGLTFVLTCALVYPSVALTARFLLGANPVVARIVSRVSGVAMIVVGVILLAEQIDGVVHA